MTKNTIYYLSNHSLMAWFYGLLLFGNSPVGIRTKFVMRQLGIGLRSAYRMMDRLRIHAAAYQRPEKIGGSGKYVYIDEFLMKNVLDEGSYVRGSAIILGIRCENVAICGIITDRTRSSIISAIEHYVHRGSILVTDGYSSYKCLSKLGWQHIVVNHSLGFHNFEGFTSNPIETFWAQLKRSCRGYQQMARKNVWKFLGEAEFRFNKRSDQVSHFDALISYFPEISERTIPALIARYDWRTLSLDPGTAKKLRIT